MMEPSDGVRLENHHRQHRVLSNEDARRQSRGELAKQPVLRTVEIVELLLLVRHFVLES